MTRLISRNEAIKRIAEVVQFDKNPPKDEATKYERIRGRIRSAQRQKNPPISQNRMADAKFCLWAMRTFSGLGYRDWMPNKCRQGEMASMAAKVPRIRGGGLMVAIPQDRGELEAAYIKSTRELYRARTEVERLFVEHEILSREVEQLKGKLDYRNRQASTYGKQGGAGNTK